VLKSIAPSTKEKKELESITSGFLKKLNGKLKGTNALAILGGSIAKDTWLKDNKDVDIFVQFPYNKYKQDSGKLSNILKKVLKEAFTKEKIVTMHGSRDYFQIEYKDIIFEIVPILKIEDASAAVNITDISPLHAGWVNSKSKKLKNEIRLAKQFCKAQKLYGAESYISGFSGYILEILVVEYGGFEALLKASAKWKEKTVLDPSNFHKNKNMVLFELNTNKLQSPLIIVDPVDKHRNAAAALGLEKFRLFKSKAKSFLKKADASYFDFQEMDLEELLAKAKKSKLKAVYLEVTALKGKRDVIGAKLLKAFNFLLKELKAYGVAHSDWDWEEGKPAQFYLLLKKDHLGKEELRRGPPIKIEEHAKQFKKKYKGYFEKDGKLYAKVKIQHPELKKRLGRIVSKKYFGERIKSLKKKVFS